MLINDGFNFRIIDRFRINNKILFILSHNVKYVWQRPHNCSELIWFLLKYIIKHKKLKDTFFYIGLIWDLKHFMHLELYAWSTMTTIVVEWSCKKLTNHSRMWEE